jgi:hypothetical protein
LEKQGWLLRSRALLDWIALGHGFAGMHSAADTYQDAPNYLDSVTMLLSRSPAVRRLARGGPTRRPTPRVGEDLSTFSAGIRWVLEL